MVFILGIWSYFGNIQVAFFELSFSLLYVFIQVLLLRVLLLVSYICKTLLFQDNLSDNFVVICMALTGQEHVFKI